MTLARNFKAQTSTPNKVDLFWDQPTDFNNSTDELIMTRTITHYPMELFNSSFPDRATDSRPIEIFKGSTITGLDSGTISVLDNVLTDTGASFSTSPLLTGRLLRDYNSRVFKILSNTATTLTLDGNPSNGKYVVLADFPYSSRPQQSFESDIRTTVDVGSISDLVIIENSALIITTFAVDELANMVFKDGSGNNYIIKSNTESTIYLFETTVTPVMGSGMLIYNSFTNSSIKPYIDNFINSDEADNRSGNGLLDDTFYYYTIFSHIINTNVAQVEFATIDSGVSTQAFGISVKDRAFGALLYNLWPSLYRELDSTSDLEDLMQVFGNFFNEIHSYIKTYNLQDSDKALITAVLPLSEQMGLPSIGYTLGSDTLRRIARELLSCWKLKGTKEGIAKFIRVITTWDITNGTGDFSGAISDFLPNVEALRFFDPNLGSLNIRVTTTDPFLSGGRFAKTLPGIVIPGFFSFREFVITLPNVALFIGSSESFTVISDATVMEDLSNNFGATNGLIGNYLLPNQEEVNDLYQIIANTNTTITVKGIVNNRTIGGDYVILSPLNTSRFTILNKLMPSAIPFGTRPGFQFIIS